MRLVGIRHEGSVAVAAVAGSTVRPLADVGMFWSDPYRHIDDRHVARCTPLDIDGLELVPPVRDDARILCVGLNYPEHVAEGPFSAPEHPTIFGRWTPSLAVSGHQVEVPVDEDGLDWEAELLAVVGRPLSVATEDEAAAGIFAFPAARSFARAAGSGSMYSPNSPAGIPDRAYDESYHVGATDTVHTGPDHPSFLQLPLVPQR